MQAIFDMFDERVQEINLYFEAIKAVLFLRGLLAGMKQYYDEKQYQFH